MPTKYAANGTVLKIGTAEAEPATTVGDVESCEIDVGSRVLIKTTALGDTTDTYVAGTKDSITITGTLVWDPGDTVHDTIIDAQLAGTLVSAGLYYGNTGATEVYSDGFFTEFSAPAAIDGKLAASFTFRGTGAPTYTQTPA